MSQLSNNALDSDLTVIFLTLNRLPKGFSDFQYQTLTRAVGSNSLITISREPMPGMNLIDTDTPGYLNIYRQLLRGARESKTPYIAVAEDDCLYPPEHFSFFRPPIDTFGYNQHRWALFTWGEPMYSWRGRKSNCTLIAPRELTIRALEERFNKWGDAWPPSLIGELGRERVDAGLGVAIHKSVEVFSSISVVQFNHTLAQEDRQRRKRKSLGNIRAYDIPHWGSALSLRQHYDT